MPVSHLLKKCVTFTKKILNGKIHFLCSVIFPCGALYLVNILISFVSKNSFVISNSLVVKMMLRLWHAKDTHFVTIYLDPLNFVMSNLYATDSPNFALRIVSWKSFSHIFLKYFENYLVKYIFETLRVWNLATWSIKME